MQPLNNESIPSGSSTNSQDQAVNETEQTDPSDTIHCDAKRKHVLCEHTSEFIDYADTKFMCTSCKGYMCDLLTACGARLEPPRSWSGQNLPKDLDIVILTRPVCAVQRDMSQPNAPPTCLSRDAGIP